MSKMQYFSKSHECFYLEDQVAIVSITEHAVDQLGEITYIQLPEIGTLVTQGNSFGEIESVKTVSELYAPISGEVIEVNSELDEHPEWMNESREEKGWLLKIKLTDSSELNQCLDLNSYQKLIDEEG